MYPQSLAQDTTFAAHTTHYTMLHQDESQTRLSCLETTFKVTKRCENGCSVCFFAERIGREISKFDWKWRLTVLVILLCSHWLQVIASVIADVRSPTRCSDVPPFGTFVCDFQKLAGFRKIGAKIVWWEFLSKKSKKLENSM